MNMVIIVGAPPWLLPLHQQKLPRYPGTMYSKALRANAMVMVGSTGLIEIVNAQIGGIFGYSREHSGPAE